MAPDCAPTPRDRAGGGWRMADGTVVAVVATVACVLAIVAFYGFG